MCPVVFVRRLLLAELGGFWMSKRKAFLTYTHALKYFSFFTKKEILANVFFLAWFSPVIFFDAVACKFTIGHFLHMRMLNRFIFLSPYSSHHVQNSCPNIYCLTMLCIYPHEFFHLGLTHSVYLSPKSIFTESGGGKKISNLSLRSTDLSTSQTIYPFFAYFLPPYSACPVQRKISNYFFSKRMLFHPRIFKIK